MTLHDGTGPDRTVTPMEEAAQEVVEDADTLLLRTLLPDDPNERRKAMSVLLRALLSSSGES